MNRQQVLDLLGPMPERVPLNPVLVETVDCGLYIREKVQFDLEPGDQNISYILLPKDLSSPRPTVYCCHQHTIERIGKSELVGLEGNPDLAYANELAKRGYIAFAPDAFTFGERRFADDPAGYAYWELVTRLIQGTSLLAKVLHDVFVSLDYLESRNEVDSERIGIIGHSYGGRLAIWAAALDHRIKAAVSNCGCISYEHSLTRDTGIQMEFVVPDILRNLDIVDMVKMVEPNALLISAAEDDKWCRGVQEVFDEASPSFVRGRMELCIYSGGHQFTKEMREFAYDFMDRQLLTKNPA